MIVTSFSPRLRLQFLKGLEANLQENIFLLVTNTHTNFYPTVKEV